MSNLKVIIGEKIRDQRKIKGLTQKELSQRPMFNIHIWGMLKGEFEISL